MSVDTEKSLQTYARIVGLMYPLSIAILLTPMLLLSNISVPGDFAQTASNVANSELTYRLILAIRIVGSMAILLLAWAFYALVRPFAPNLALFALMWRVFEVALGNMQTVIRFGALENYGNTADIATRQAMHEMAFGGDAGALHVAAIFFSVGSVIFFYVLFKSRFLPRAWSAFCIIASLIVTLFGFAHILIPEQASSLGIWEWTPALIAEVGTGLWLLIRGANLDHWRATIGRAPQDRAS